MNGRWVSQQALLLLHGDSLATHGGREGMRDEGLLESALMRPQNLAAYADAGQPPDTAALAASYGGGIAKNHPFVDDNKRAAFLPPSLSLPERISLAGRPGRRHAPHAGRRRRRYPRGCLCLLVARASGPQAAIAGRPAKCQDAAPSMLPRRCRPGDDAPSRRPSLRRRVGPEVAVG